MIMLKMREGTTWINYKRINTQHQTKLELIENVQTIDFTMLIIENENQIHRITEKEEQLRTMKNNMSKKGQQLVLERSRLKEVTVSINKTKNEIRVRKRKLDKLKGMLEENTNGLNDAQKTLLHLKTIQARYTCPDVRSYMELDATTRDTKRQIETLKKQCKHDKQTSSFFEPPNTHNKLDV